MAHKSEIGCKASEETPDLLRLRPLLLEWDTLMPFLKMSYKEKADKDMKEYMLKQKKKINLQFLCFMCSW